MVGRLSFFAFNDLFAPDQHVGRGFNANTNGISIDFYNRDANILADLKPLTEPPAQDQHGAISLNNSCDVHP
jgi:hypothetical protein